MNDSGLFLFYCTISAASSDHLFSKTQVKHVKMLQVKMRLSISIRITKLLLLSIFVRCIHNMLLLSFNSLTFCTVAIR